MGAVAERLVVTEAALAPEVDVPIFDFDHVGTLLGNFKRVAQFFWEDCRSMKGFNFVDLC